MNMTDNDSRPTPLKLRLSFHSGPIKHIDFPTGSNVYDRNQVHVYFRKYTLFRNYVDDYSSDMSLQLDDWNSSFDINGNYTAWDEKAKVIRMWLNDHFGHIQLDFKSEKDRKRVLKAFKKWAGMYSMYLNNDGIFEFEVKEYKTRI